MNKLIRSLAVTATVLFTTTGAILAQDTLQDRLAASEEMRANRPSQAALEAAAPAPPAVSLPEDYVAAINQLRLIAPSRPDDLEAWQRLAFHEVEMRNYVGAADAQERVIEIKGDDAPMEDYQRLLDLLVVAAGGLVSPEAEQLLREILERDVNNVAARYYLGALYNQTSSPDLALRLWLDVIEAGDPDNFHVSSAIAQAGDAAIRAGTGNAEAIKWYRLVAVQGDADAQNKLGGIYNEGIGVPQDYAEALKWYRLAAKQGYASAQNNLGLMYHNGYGVSQDYAEAVIWYRKAAEQGHASAQSNFGEVYQNGHGVLLDAVLAHMWFNIGAANGHLDGSRRRDVMERDMTSEQVTDAQARARICMASNYQDCD